MSIKAYKYRISANTQTTDKLQWVLDRCREVYNAGLQERRDAYEMKVKRHPSYYDEEVRKQLSKEYSIWGDQQRHDLVEIKATRPEYQDIASHVLQDVIVRLDNAFKAFFRRVKNGEVPSYPRFQRRTRYTSFTYPDKAGWKLATQERPDKKKGMVRVPLKLTKIGTVKVHLHRDMAGTIKTLTIKREGEHWYAVFTCEIGTPKPLPMSHEDVGIDLGITHFAALSNGVFVENPRYFRRGEQKLAQAQRSLARKKRGSHRRTRAAKRVATCHRTVHNQRQDFLHKQSRILVNRYQVIGFEALQIKNMMKRPKPKKDEVTGQYLPNGAASKAGLNKSIQDAGWRTFTEMTRVKAGWAGRRVVFVDPDKTSQICSRCLKQGPHKDLSVRVHVCEHCGIVLDRDTNAAINVLQRAHQDLLGGTRPTPGA